MFHGAVDFGTCVQGTSELGCITLKLDSKQWLEHTVFPAFILRIHSIEGKRNYVNEENSQRCFSVVGPLVCISLSCGLLIFLYFFSKKRSIDLWFILLTRFFLWPTFWRDQWLSKAICFEACVCVFCYICLEGLMLIWEPYRLALKSSHSISSYFFFSLLLCRKRTFLVKS